MFLQNQHLPKAETNTNICLSMWLENFSAGFSVDTHQMCKLNVSSYKMDESSLRMFFCDLFIFRHSGCEWQFPKWSDKIECVYFSPGCFNWFLLVHVNLSLTTWVHFCAKISLSEKFWWNSVQTLGVIYRATQTSHHYCNENVVIVECAFRIAKAKVTPNRTTISSVLNL